MTNPAATVGPHLAKFQTLLRELFQFDCADLDFGIYRIMNHKRDTIEKFITQELPDSIDEELNKGLLGQQSKVADDFARVAQRVRETLGDSAMGANGELDQAYRASVIGQEYLAVQEAASGGGRSTNSLEASIYNHLYTFFSRYYQEGDFVSKRRYSRNQRYAIPYNGEEVYLHWANSDQYYVKTSEHFHNYDWTAPNGVSVKFRLRSANTEQNNGKGDKRFFLPRADETEWDATARTITIPFEYRPLNIREGSVYGSRNQRDKIIAAANITIPQRLANTPEGLAALTHERRRKGNDQSVSHLEHHLRQYTRRNDSDFFIHKDLSGFLSRELDFYLKNEVLDIDEITNAGERMAEGWFQLLRLIKYVGGPIIEFLAQIENFQKMLWEKRKFVTETQYCITLGSIDTEFYEDIIDNTAQWVEWQELFAIESGERSHEVLKANPTLVVDTKHFNANFTDRLLASFDDLDGITDGLLVHSENWQALQLLTNRYLGRVNFVYIDPPYNTDATPILYKNDYRESSWLTLLESRLLSSKWLHDKGHSCVCIAIDDTELDRLSLLLRKTYFDHDLFRVVVNHYPGSGTGRSNVTRTHEYALFLVPHDSDVLRGKIVASGERERNFRRSGTGDNNLRTGRPNSFYAVLVEPNTREIKGVEPPPTDDNYPIHPTEEGHVRIYPIGENNLERVWTLSYESAIEAIKSNILRVTERMVINRKYDDVERRNLLPSLWTDTKFSAVSHGTNLLKHLFAVSDIFSYPKSLYTVDFAIEAATHSVPNAIVLDYFAGSGTTGHATIHRNREDGGRREFILVEAGDHFNTVLLPRIKKVTFSPEWRDGKPQRQATAEEIKRSPRIIKYIRLESYEDVLDGIEFDDTAGQLKLEDRISGYLLKYMLKWETKHSRTLLKVEQLNRPFDYLLRTQADGNTRERTAEVTETFNYLMGLIVRTRRVYYDGCQRYLVYRGETRQSPGHEVVVIWRDTDGWEVDDFERDRQFVSDCKITEGSDTVYINGASCIPNAKAVESMFHDRMFAGIFT